MVQRNGLVGTARYTSVNAHLGLEQSRRDDLQSILYLIVYFIKGSLPWQNLPIKNTNEKFKRIAEIKANIRNVDLCEAMPYQLVHMFDYVNSLEFE